MKMLYEEIAELSLFILKKNFRTYIIYILTEIIKTTDCLAANLKGLPDSREPISVIFGSCKKYTSSLLSFLRFNLYEMTPSIF